MDAEGKRSWRWLELGVVLFALWIAWDVGRRGFMPLDQSVVFDGGWRILSGQVPWRDFHAPSFVTPSVIQAAFFGVLGVSWWSYLAHAMLANALLAWLVLIVARRLDLGKAVSAALGLGSAVIFYPAIGTPFADQEAFLFSFAAVAAALLARTSRCPREGLLRSCVFMWALVPGLVTLGFFSKQLPAALVPLVLAVLLILPSARPRGEGLVGLGLGLAVVAVTASLLMVGLGIEPSRIRYDLFELPLGEAELRRSYLPASPVRLAWHFVRAGVSQGLWVPWWLHATALGVLAASAVKLGRRILGSEAFWLVLLGELLFHLDLVTLVLTNNQDGAGVAWFFLSAAPVLAALKLSFKGSLKVFTRISTGGSMLLLLLIVLDAARFHVRHNLTRSVNDMQFAGGVEAGDALPELAPLLWATPEHHGYPLEDLTALVEALRGKKGELFLVGDSAVLYGLVGTASTSPSLWFHPGVSFPKRGTKGFGQWQDRIVEGVRSGRIRRIVEEVAGTWIGNLGLADFPRIDRVVRERGFVVEEFGAFRVLELAPPLGSEADE